MGPKSFEVPVDKLTVVCNPNSLGFETTSDVKPLEGTIGQERAVSALEFGLGIDAPGFNVYVSGQAGTGRNTTLKSYLERAAAKRPVPNDWGYVHNFSNPSSPMAIDLPCGMINALKEDMDELVEGCKRDLPKAFDSEEFHKQLEDVLKQAQVKKNSIYGGLEQEAGKLGYAINLTQAGIMTIPLKKGRPMERQEYEALAEDERSELVKKGEELQQVINHQLVEIRRLDKDTAQKSQDAAKQLGLYTIRPHIQELKEKYHEYSKVLTYLDAVQSDIVDHLDAFRPGDEKAQAPAPPPWIKPSDDFVKYRVNPLMDNKGCRSAPIVYEYSPTYYNLFGRIEYNPSFGTMSTDLTLIKAGAIHKANGGYLVVQAVDLLTSPFSWATLKRTLRSQQARIENLGEQYNSIPTVTLSPEPIPVDAKIVIVGSPYIYYLLQAQDEDFRKYFKVKADFDTSMERTQENITKYAEFIARQCQESGLRPFHKSAVAKIIDFSSRLVEDQQKVTTRFIDITDMITEANYWADQDNNSKVIKAVHVQKAIDQRLYRASLPEDRLREYITDGIIHISTEGKAVGQVNGLAVLALGDYMFGKPSRITASVSLGRGQVVNIEREIQMSGPIHSKGFLILSGYISGKYGQNKPLSLSASIGFEQTYDEVDGDSASSTELYTLLSSLSSLPIKQNIAVTGSVNQFGEVQAIGGATHKIEGFFSVCKAKGLTGDQGVMIPKDNVRNLVLKDEVVEAVKKGKFHIYAVSTIDEGIELLTGAPAGTLQKDGTYPKGTVHFLVEKRLQELAKSAKEFGAPEAKDNGKGKQEEKRPAKKPRQRK